MIEYLENEFNKTKTENGAAAYESTGSHCLDLFASVGALRYRDKNDVIDLFVRAYVEDKDAAMKILFYARDIREGLGERKTFKTILRYLASAYPESVIKNLPYVATYGRFDDVLCLLDTPCENDVLKYLKERFDEDVAALKDGKKVSLLGKWLPSINAHDPQAIHDAKKIAAYFSLSLADYRKTLSALRKRIDILENRLREIDYTFDYSKQPSKAMFKYREAFFRYDYARYSAFLDSVQKGEAKMNADALYPYELIDRYLDGRFFWTKGRLTDISAKEAAALNATWASLPNYAGDEDALVVVDTSGSMYCASNPTPAAVALSLGLYFAERNKGAFANSFIMFSRKPRFVKLKGETFVDKLRYITTFSCCENTDIQAVFNTVLSAAVNNKVPQSELPKRIIVVSDMEFDICVSNADETNFENAKRKFEEAGYTLPNVVFWNVACRNSHQPVRKNDAGVCLVSGCTPRLFSMVTSGDVNPYSFMLEVINKERYAIITA